MNQNISVIVPVYNVEKYLTQCVESILSQDNSNLEVILIDDGSTDRSGEICDQFAARDSRVQVIHQKNAGAAAARNAAIEIAKGEYLRWQNKRRSHPPDYFSVPSDSLLIVFFYYSTFVRLSQAEFPGCLPALSWTTMTPWYKAKPQSTIPFSARSWTVSAQALVSPPENTQKAAIT